MAANILLTLKNLVAALAARVHQPKNPQQHDTTPDGVDEPQDTDQRYTSRGGIDELQNMK